MAEIWKDAIHVAIAKVTAGENLERGDNVGFKDVEGVVFKDAQWIGIVNPFGFSVKKDSMFELWLKPNTVTSLRHDWEHPLFNRDDNKVAIADNWLRYILDYENDWGDGQEKEYSNYDWIVREFKEGRTPGCTSGDRFCDLFRDNADGFRKKFWDNLEIATGVMATPEMRQLDYWGCSC